MQQVRTCPRTLSPRRLGRSPRAAAGARTGTHMSSTRVLQTPQSRTAGPRRWPVKPGVETTPDAVLRRSVSLKPAVMQPCAVRAHRCAPLACGARSARERTPLRHRGPTGSMRSYVKPCGRTPTRAVVRSSARSYLRAPPRYDRATPGTTVRRQVRPRDARYDRTPPGTTTQLHVRPCRTPRHRTTGTRPPQPHPTHEEPPKLLPEKMTAADTATIFSLAIPYSAAPKGRIAFTVRRPDRSNDPVVDIE